MTELKVSLKEAKNAIKDKDFEAAMIHSKDALKIDRKNYQALAMFGRACQELRKFSDSKKALMLATQVDPSNPVAWQGLISLHEKNDSVFTEDEEIAVLSHMKEITKEEEKLDRIVRKLANIYYKHDRISEAVSLLESYADTLTSEEQILELRKLIIKCLEDISKPSDEVINKLISSYETLLNDNPFEENETNFQIYLRLVYKTKNYKMLTEGARKMYRVFPIAYPLEWISRAYVEYTEIDKDTNLLADETVSEYVEKLLTLYKGSQWGNLAQGIIFQKRGDLESAKLYLRRGSELLGNNLLPWLILLNCQSKLGDYVGIENTCRKMLRILENNSDNLVIPSKVESIGSLQQSLVLTHASALFQLGHINHIQEAISLLEKVPDKDLETSVIYVKALLKVQKVDLADKELELLKKEHGESPLLKVLAAYIARHKGDTEVAKQIYEEVLENNPSCSDTLFELGRIYFTMQDYQKALINLLKAAKYNPKMSSAFLYLGHYYKKIDNLDKARKCYEKAFALNSTNDDAGAGLSDIYRLSNDHDSNLALLARVTSEAGRCSSGWAWFRLGLHHLSQKDYAEAVHALQCAVQINAYDRVCYECLGDAYLSRGSHTAALKVFTKAVELDPNEAYYSRCKIAHINHIIGELLSSVSEYEKVLSENLPMAVRTVALVGLSEVLLTRARKYKRERFLSNVKEDCLYAIKCLTMAASDKGSCVTIWKLLGDAFTLMTVVPPSQAAFFIPSRLVNASVTDLESFTEVRRDEMLALGGRCYGVGLHICETNASLWHDFGVNSFLQSWVQMKVTEGKKISPDDEDKETFTENLERAITAVKKALTLDSLNYNAWNSLGVITFFNGDFDLSQHAFIRSLELHPTVESWTHLGALYLHRKEIHLAHEAFSQAQALDPGFIACWVGQAMVADAIGHYEAFDLYRHTTLLGIHPESCLGHAENVLQIMCQPPDKGEPRSSVLAMLPAVADSLLFYTREKELDVVGLNMCGLALEMVGLKNSSADVYARALENFREEIMPPELQCKILMNYSRTLTSLDRLNEAVIHYSEMQEPDFYSQCGLALAKLKAGHYDEAYQKYTEALVWLAPDDAQKSHVLVALAFLQYHFQNIEQVKTLLFQSSSVQGLLALTALGLLQGDATLTEAALMELKPFTDSKEHSHHIAFLKATQATLQGDLHKAKLILCHAVHLHPYNTALWRYLSQHLLTMTASGPRTSAEKIAEGAKYAASAAATLAQVARDNDRVAQDVVMKAMAYLKAVHAPVHLQQLEAPKKKGKAKVQELKQQQEEKRERIKALSLVEAQRAVLMCPSKPESWAVLVATMGTGTNRQTKRLAQFWSSAAKPDLKIWLQNIQVERCL